MKVEQIMTHQVHACGPEDTTDAAARIMWEHDCGCVPVVKAIDGSGPEVVGMITDRDICMAAYTTGQSLGKIRVGAVMSRDVSSCQPNDPVDLALKIMETNQLHRLPVVDGQNQLAGVISLADIAREALRERRGGHGDLSELRLADALEAITKTRQAESNLTVAA